MFEHSLFDLETGLEAKRQPRRRRWISLPLAVGLHLVALTAFAFASYWNVGSVPEPDLNVAFIDVTLPPPMIQQGGGAPPPPVPIHKPASTPPAPETVRQPDLEKTPDKAPEPVTPVPDAKPSVPGTDPTAPTGPGDPHGDPNSRSEVGDIHGTPEPVAPVGDGLPIHLTAEMSRPQPLRPILPRYTEAARRAGLQGTVVVEAIIDEQGRATNIRVVHGVQMGLDRAAVEAIEQTPFKPAMMGGRPVKVYFNLTVNFTIQR
jgi:protein TonB